MLDGLRKLFIESYLILINKNMTTIKRNIITIKKAVYSNPGYKNLPTRSPGFEDENL